MECDLERVGVVRWLNGSILSWSFVRLARERCMAYMKWSWGGIYFREQNRVLDFLAKYSYQHTWRL